MKPASEISNQSNGLVTRAESKNIDALRKRLVEAIYYTGHPNKESVESVLKSAKDKKILLHALNDDHKDGYPLELACGICAKAAQNGPLARYLSEMKKNALLLLDHGADPNLSNCPDHETPIQLLLSLDVRKNETPQGYKFKFKDLIVKFIEKGADLTVIGHNDFTLIHMAAALDREVLALICDKLPAEWVNKTNRYGETALFSAIRFKNTSTALELILNRNIDLNILNFDESHALSASIFFLTPQVTQCMLAQGCSIDLYGNIIFRDLLGGPHAEAQKKILLILMKAGYYLSLNNRMAQHEGLYTYFEFDLDGAVFLFALEDVNTKQIEYITSINDLLASKSHISAAQNKRLHQSFQETIRALEADDDLTLQGLLALYKIFKSAYPCNEEIILPPMASKEKKAAVQQSKSLNIWDIKSLLADATKAPQNNELLVSLAQTAKEIFHDQQNAVLEIDKIKRLLQNYNVALMKSLSVMGEQQLSNSPFDYYISKLSYHFVMHLVPKFIKQAQKQDIRDAHDALIFLMSLAISFNLKYQDKTLDESTVLIDRIIALYDKHDINTTQTLYFISIRQIFLLRNYAEFGCHKEMVDAVNVLIKHKSDYDRELAELRRLQIDKRHFGLLYNLDRGIVRSLEMLDHSSIDLSTYYALISQTEFFADRYLLSDTQKQCVIHKAYIMARYKTFIESFNVLSVEQNGLFIITLVNDELRVNFHNDASKTRIRHALVSPGVILSDMKGFYISIYGMSFDEIQKRIDHLKNFKFDEFKRGEQAKPLTVNAESKDWYYVAPAIHNSSSSSSSSSSTVSKPKEKIQPANDKTAEFENKCVRIKNQIVQAHHVAPDNVFLIHAPWLPKGREHKAWGIWGEITGENADRIPEQLIDEHKVIAQNGKVVTKAAGESGLKSTMILNSQTHKKERTIKTKKLGNDGDLRIVSTPEDFVSEGENLKLYRFGITSFHK